jgi:dolichol-phosphate mannosyltransferase
MKISVIVPTYNEAENIKKLIPKIDSVLKCYDYEIVVVDDNSPDGTAKVAEKLAEQYPVRVLKRNNKLGLASAILYGFMNANGDVLGVIDADLQHPPELLNEMAKKIKDGYDIVIASRYVKCGGIEGWSFHRLLISKVAILLAKPLTSVKDPMSGCFLLRRKVIEGVNFNPTGYKLLLEILVKGNYKRVAEVPYVFRNRAYGQSKLGPSEILRYIRLILHLYNYKIRRR